MDGATMRAICAYIAELRRDREYHRASQHSPRNPKEDAIHNRSQGHGSGDGGRNQDSPGKSGYNL
jgi:hypothetical protein